MVKETKILEEEVINPELLEKNRKRKRKYYLLLIQYYNPDIPLYISVY